MGYNPDVHLACPRCGSAEVEKARYFEKIPTRAVRKKRSDYGTRRPEFSRKLEDQLEEAAKERWRKALPE